MNRPGREVVGWVTRGRQDGESEVERRKGGEKERKNDTLFTLRVKNDKKKLITRERKNKQEEPH